MSACSGPVHVYSRTVTDPQTGQSRVLTDDEVAMIERMTQGLYPHEDFDPHAVSTVRVCSMPMWQLCPSFWC